MPSWIKIEVKDSDEKSGRQPAKKKRAQSQESSRLPLIFGALLVLVVVAGAGFLLWDRVLGSGGSVVAVVNGQQITQQELTTEQSLFVTMSTLTQGRAPADAPSEFDILNQMIGDRLKYNEAVNAGITVSASEVASQISAIEAQAGFTDAQLNAALVDAGLNRDVLQEWIGRQIAINKYVSAVVMQNVPPEAQDEAVRSWSNQLQTQADVEIRLGSGGARSAAKVGEPAPDFVLPTPDGGRVRLSDLRGQPVLLNFWATWCPPCKIEMPDIEALYQKYKDQGFRVVAIDQQETPAAVTAYFDEMELTFQPAIDSSGEIFSLYRVVALPTSYFIDANGVVQIQHRGYMTREAMEDYASRIMSN